MNKIWTPQSMIKAIETTKQEAFLLHDLEKLDMLKSKYEMNTDIDDEEIKEDLRFLDKFYVD
jgi:hypothetical protein